MIYKIGIISKRYVTMFGILRWHTLEREFLCCTFLLVRLVSCPAIAFVSARFASWLFIFLVWVHLKRDTTYRRYPTTSRHKLPTAKRFVTK